MQNYHRNSRIRVLHLSRVPVGGVATVMERVTTNIDQKRYAPYALMYPAASPTYLNSLSNAGVTVLNHPETIFKDSPSFNGVKKRDLGMAINNLLGNFACRLYLSFKDIVFFLRKGLPEVYYFFKVFKKNKIDLIHVHGNLPQSKPEILAAWLIGAPCICHIHSYLDYNYWDRIFISLASSFIFISHSVEAHYLKQGVPKQKGIVVHNGVEPKLFDEPASKNTLRSDFALSSNHIVVGLIGRVDWWKGQDFFIKSIAIASAVYPQIRGCIIGFFSKSAPENNSRYFKRLKALVRDLNLESTIIFTGQREDIPIVFNDIDILVHASSEPEPFGLVVIEGMAAGKPVIATEAGGVLDIVESGVNGMLVPVKSEQAIAQAILELISDPIFAKKIAKEAKATVEKKFTIIEQVNKIQRLYEEIT